MNCGSRRTNCTLFFFFFILTDKKGMSDTYSQNGRSPGSIRGGGMAHKLVSAVKMIFLCCPGILLLFSIFTAPALYAQGGTPASPALIVAGEDSYTIGTKMEIFEDRSGNLTFSQILSPNYSRRFNAVDRMIPNYGFSRSAWWVRFRIHFAYLLSEDEWVLKYRWPFVSSITAYIDDKGGAFRCVETGIESPRETRDIPHRLFLFRLHPEAGGTATVYLRIRTEGIVILPLQVLSYRSMIREIFTENLYFGIFLGFMGAMVFYYLLMFAAVREHYYIYFSLFIILQLFFQAFNDGTAAWNLALTGKTANLLIIASASLITIFIALFTRPILNSDRFYPRARYFFYCIIAMSLLFPIGSFFFPRVFTWSLFFIMLLLFVLFFITISLLCFFTGGSSTLFYVLFILVFAATASVSILLRFDIVPYNLFTEHLRKGALVAEGIILAFMINRKIRTLERERIEAQAASITALEHADRMKNEFLATTSHELRTPLHGIVGISEVMLKNRRPLTGDDGRENLKIISSSARRLLSQINDLLDYSKMSDERAQNNLALTALPLRDHVSFVFTLLASFTEGRAIELRNSVSPELPLLYADEERLRQILLNLVSNAIKFTEFGVIEILAEERAGGTIAVTVSDTGTGVDEAKIGQIFEPFVQGDSSHSRKYPGTGLGLSISRRLVELHGGTIELTSQKGKGTEVTFTIRKASASEISASISRGETPGGLTDENLPESDITAPPASSLTGKSGEAPLVLIVDDDDVSIKVLSGFFAIKEYPVLSAASGSAALEILDKNRRINMVLLDLMMPGISGFEVLRRIRKSRPAEDLPVIVTSALSQIDDVRHAYAAGANDYLIKPFNIDELSQRIDRFFAVMKIVPPAESGISVKTTSGREIIHYRDICYLAADGKHCRIYLRDQSCESKVMLKDLELRLPPFFLRINRSYIINLNCLERIENRDRWSCDAVLKWPSNTRITVGRTYLHELKTRFR